MSQPGLIVTKESSMSTLGLWSEREGDGRCGWEKKLASTEHALYARNHAESYAKLLLAPF